MRQEPSYQNRIIAFLDILGFSDKVKQSVSSDFVRANIEEILKTFNRAMVNPEFLNGNINDKLARKVTSFSDNVVISYSNRCSLLEAIYDIGRIQVLAMEMGFLLRGGITIGELRHTQEVLFGPGMNEAYKLESKVAIYPRVILTNETIDKATLHPFFVVDSIENDRKLIKHIYCKKDTDGLYYIDYLSDDLMEGDLSVILLYHRKLQKVSEDYHGGEPGVIQKYDWLKSKIEEYDQQTQQTLSTMESVLPH